MLNLKWVYLTSAVVCVTILSLFSHQKVVKPRPKYSLRSFVGESDIPHGPAVSVVDSVGSAPTNEQAPNGQLFWNKQKHSDGVVSYSSLTNKSTAPLTLPFPLHTFPPEKLLQQQWVMDLWQFVSEIPLESPPIHIVAGNYAYRGLLLNWLIAAKAKITPPLSNVIIISIDKPLCDLLSKRNIACLFATWKAFLTENMNAFRLILILRLTVIRLLNHWGYDAANIDADAIIIKNPEPLYNQYRDSDMVAGRGTYPTSLGREWGATICGGTFLIRSTPQTENFWSTMSRMSNERKLAYDDQVRLNYALKLLNPIWHGSDGKPVNSRNKKTTLTAHASGFTVTLLPAEVICRSECKEELQSHYYVWHKLTGRNLQSKTAKTGNARLWYLKKDWETLDSKASGVQWLKEISLL